MSVQSKSLASVIKTACEELAVKRTLKAQEHYAMVMAVSSSLDPEGKAKPFYVADREGLKRLVVELLTSGSVEVVEIAVGPHLWMARSARPNSSFHLNVNGVPILCCQQTYKGCKLAKPWEDPLHDVKAPMLVVEGV